MSRWETGESNDCAVPGGRQVKFRLEKKLRMGLDKDIYLGKFMVVNDSFPSREAGNLMTEPRLGRVQLKIMQVLWEKGRANAREITEALNREAPIAHSTVQTLLRKLEAKGSVAHEAVERHLCLLSAGGRGSRAAGGFAGARGARLRRLRG